MLIKVVPQKSDPPGRYLAHIRMTHFHIYFSILVGLPYTNVVKTYLHYYKMGMT